MESYDKVFFDNLFKGDGELYFAHLPKPEQKWRKPELLSEHSALTFAYAKELVKVNGLSPVIKRLVNDSIPKKLTHQPLLAEMMEDLFWQAIAFHDLGKINHLFQEKRMNNNSSLFKVDHEFDSQHSIISAYLYLALFFDKFIKMDLTDEEQIFLSNTAIYLCNPIMRHHSSTIGQCQDESDWSEMQNGDYSCRKNVAALSQYLRAITCEVDGDLIEKFNEFFIGNVAFLFSKYNENLSETELGFPLYALVKLLYSLLTASDYLATAHYMNDWDVPMVGDGFINDELRNRITQNARSSKKYNSITYECVDNGCIPNPNDYVEQSNANLNKLRTGIAAEVILNIRQNNDKRLFYIEAPTGGGKTNASILAMAELLKADQTLQKVFYVFPFTTLITQTYQTLKETLGLANNEIAEIHSKALFNTGKYEDDYLNYLDYQFMDYPVALLSHVRFFDILKTNGKETNYLLHRLANSIVVIDEIQSYPPTIWNKMVYFIANYAKYFNIRFVVMSATLPKIGELIDQTIFKDNFTYLIKDKNRYFQNPNFQNRVHFDYTLLDWKRPDRESKTEYLTNLAKFVILKSEEYASANNDSVFTIIEFIFKSTASEFHSIVNKIDHCFDDVFLLSGTILEPRRQEIIRNLKSTDYRQKRILLVTTQVVEAGVDIDMDLGFKDKSIIDSEEQLAGRINRNVNKPSCALYLFDSDSEKTLYGGDDRYKIMRDELGIETYKQIIETKDFDLLYQLVINAIKRKDQSAYIKNINDLYGSVSRLDFPEVNNAFQIISQSNVSVFVPLTIEKKKLPESFVSEIEMLIGKTAETINGADIWDKYIELIHNPQNEFIANKILMRKVASVMSLFSFSIFPNGKDYETLKNYGKDEYGFLYLNSYNDIYSFENGINTTTFKETSFS